MNESTYTIIAGGQGIQCLICLHTSYHPRDVSDRYCGQCHRFHETKISWTEQKEANEQLNDLVRFDPLRPSWKHGVNI